MLDYLTTHFDKETFEKGAEEVKGICEFYNSVRTPVKRLYMVLRETWGIQISGRPSAKVVLTLLTALVGERKHIGAGSSSTP